MNITDLASDIFLGTDNALNAKNARTDKFLEYIRQGMSPDAAEEAVSKLMPKSRIEKGLGKFGDYVTDAGRKTHQQLFNAADQIPVGKGGFTATRLAGNNPAMKAISKAIPLIGAGAAVLDAGDIVFGQDSAANKVMDGTAMAIGGTIGGVLGMGNPLLAAAGASTGKAVSDGLQYLFGDKKTAEQRKMEEALAALQGRYI